MVLALISASEKTARYRDPPSPLISDRFAHNRWSVGCTIGIFVKRLRVPAFSVGFPRIWCLVQQSARRCPRLPFSSADNDHRHRMHGLAAYPGVSFRSWTANDVPLFAADGISRRERVDLATVKELMGHASISTTMRYAHPSPPHKREAVGRLDSAQDIRKPFEVATSSE